MPIYKKETFDDGGTIAVWRITETEEELRDIAAVPTDELETIESLPSHRRRIESFAVRALLNTLFDDRVYIGYEEDNSPYIKNAHYGISISHSGEFACVYIHENDNVGIDIESLNRNFYAVEAKVLTKYERDYINTRHKQEQLALIWSAKEAIYKLMCERDASFSTQIEINKFIPHDEEGELSATFTSADGEEYDLNLNYQIFDEYVMVWVTL